MFTNTSTQFYLFAMVSNMSSMEFGLIEESSLVRRKSLLVARDRWQSACMANTAYAERNIVEAVPFGGGSVMVWGCVSYDCKLDLITVRGDLNGQI